MRSVIIQASIKQTRLEDMHEVLLPVILNLSILKISTQDPSRAFILFNAEISADDTQSD